GVVSGKIDVSGINGGGVALIGGDYKGQGTASNALLTYVSRDSEINADARANGNGGKVIVWADGTTGFYGKISALGGSESGNGGFVEVSGKENLIFRGGVEVGAVNGDAGTLLLDPENIRIVAGNGGANDDQIIDSQILKDDIPGATFTISQTTLENLGGNTNVILEATNNITIDSLAPDPKDNNKEKLTFQAGTGSITFTADADENQVGSFLMYNPEKIQQIGNSAEDNQSIGTIVTQGRGLTIKGASITAGGIDTSGVSPDNVDPSTLPPINGGKVTLTASVGDIIVRFIDTSAAQNNNGDKGGDILITASGLFRATGVAPGVAFNASEPVASIFSAGSIDFNQPETKVLGGTITIKAQSASGNLEVGAKQDPTKEDVGNLGSALAITLIIPFNFSTGASGTRGAIVSGNTNGLLSSVYVDTGIANGAGVIKVGVIDTSGITKPPIINKPGDPNNPNTGGDPNNPNTGGNPNNPNTGGNPNNPDTGGNPNNPNTEGNPNNPKIGDNVATDNAIETS
ncbi:MAG: hypothetical protein ACRDEA_08975, partial [Microcystaceae cyanobacterium]